MQTTNVHFRHTTIDTISYCSVSNNILTITVTYPTVAVQAGLLLRHDVDIVNCVDSKQTLAGAELYHNTHDLNINEQNMSCDMDIQHLRQ